MSIYFSSSHPQQHLNTCLAVLTWHACFWGRMLHNTTFRESTLAEERSSLDPVIGTQRSLSGSLHYTHAPLLLSGYKTGVGFFSFFIFTAASWNEYPVSRLAGMLWEGVISQGHAGCRTETVKLHRGCLCHSGEGGMAGRWTPHTWSTSGLTCWASMHGNSIQKERWTWKPRLRWGLLLLPSPRWAIAASLELMDA